MKISVTMITKNEEARIEAALKSVAFAEEIIIIDSESTDRTRDIAQKYGAKVVSQPFLGFGQQKNKAHALATQPWVLNLDADERISPELEKEISKAIQNPDFDGYLIPRRTWYIDRWIMHNGWFPNPLVRLARTKKSRWTEPYLHEELQVEGKVGRLKNPLDHYSFPSVRAHVEKNLDYAEHARKQHGGIKKDPGLTTLLLKPTWKFIHMYFIKLGFLDGRAGFVVAVNSAYSTFLKYAYEWEQRRNKK